jgi:hypothetical protein
MDRHYFPATFNISIGLILLLTLNACAFLSNPNQSALNLPNSSAVIPTETCVLIDTDFDLDDGHSGGHG